MPSLLFAKLQKDHYVQTVLDKQLWADWAYNSMCRFTKNAPDKHDGSRAIPKNSILSVLRINQAAFKIKILRTKSDS